MKNKINLYWYKHNEGHGNFGDELNPYIINKISSSKVNYFDVKMIFDDKILAIKSITYLLINRKISFTLFFKYLYANFINQPKILFGIGSILQYTTLTRLNVWGAGIVKKDACFSNAHFNAVRGKYTQKRLKELNYNIPEVIGDPALLLPLLYKPNGKKNHKIGIIPHYIQYQELKELENEDVTVINLLAPIEEVIDNISSCDVTLSTSLHGIITSHAYGVPSIWSLFEQVVTEKLAGDDVKFMDYFSSVNIKEYEPMVFEVNDIKGQIENISKEIELLPNENLIKEIQLNLLSSAPFPLVNVFKNLIIDK